MTMWDEENDRRVRRAFWGGVMFAIGWFVLIAGLCGAVAYAQGLHHIHASLTFTRYRRKP